MGAVSGPVSGQSSGGGPSGGDPVSVLFYAFWHWYDPHRVPRQPWPRDRRERERWVYAIAPAPATNYPYDEDSDNGSTDPAQNLDTKKSFHWE